MIKGEKDVILITTNGIYPWSFVTQSLRNLSQVMMVTVKLSKWWLHLHIVLFPHSSLPTTFIQRTFKKN